MSLRRQLMLVSLLLLSLPWAGCQFVREMEGALQLGQEQALLATTAAVATVLTDQPEQLYPDLRRLESGEAYTAQIYALPTDAPIIVDGYDDGWNLEPFQSWGPVSYRALTHARRLYLFFDIGFQSSPGSAATSAQKQQNYDLTLRTGRGIDYLIAYEGPGPVQARATTNRSSRSWDSRIRGYWQDTPLGVSLELEMPLDLTANRLGFYLKDMSHEQAAYGNLSLNQQQAPWLVYVSNTLQSVIEPFSSGNLALNVIDIHHWKVGSAGQTKKDSYSESGSVNTETPWPVRLLYRAILSHDAEPPLEEASYIGQFRNEEVILALSGSPSARWYGATGGEHKIISAASPIYNGDRVVGAVVARQNSEQYLSLTDAAFGQLLSYSLGAMVLSALGLLGYASLLSWRIRRLSIAAEEIIQPDGSIYSDFPVSRQADEIGELSRNYANLLGRIQEYTEYLRTLSRKLSHELRTPIAVIQSSLDNLEQEPELTSIYIQRSREGLARLTHILTAMSESSRLEESIQQSVREVLELNQFCQELLAAYETVYPGHRLNFQGTEETIHIEAAPELLAQMLDKLFDNAASFAPPDGKISLALEIDQGHKRLTLSNEGPALPEQMQNQLFDSMVSVREDQQSGHLGLGLHIAQLIAEFHGWRIYGENRKAGDGVVFIIELDQ